MIPNWSQSRSAALDIKVIHTLKNSKISDACQTSGASAAVSEEVLWVVSKEAKCEWRRMETGKSLLMKHSQELLGSWSSTPTHPTLNSKCNVLLNSVV